MFVQQQLDLLKPPPAKKTNPPNLPLLAGIALVRQIISCLLSLSVLRDLLLVQLYPAGGRRPPADQHLTGPPAGGPEEGRRTGQEGGGSWDGGGGGHRGPH